MRALSLPVGVLLCALSLLAPAAARATFSAPEELGQGSWGTSAVAATDAAGTTTALLSGVAAGLQLRERSGGAAWQAAEPLALDGAREPALAAAGHGALALAWRIDRPRRYTGIGLLWREPGGLRSGPVVIADDGAGGVRHPAVAVDPDGDVLLAYNTGTRATQHSLRGGIAIAFHRRGAGGVVAPVIIEPRRSGVPVAALAADGRGVVAWVRDHRIWAVAVDAGTGQAGRPEAVADARRLRSLAAAAGPGGGATLAWAAWHAVGPRSRARAQYEVRAVSATAGGFGGVRVLAAGGNFTDGVALAADAAGTTTIAWRERSFGRNRDHAVVSGMRAATAAPGRPFSRPRTLQPPSGEDCTAPRVAVAAGHSAVAWGCLGAGRRAQLKVAVGGSGGPAATQVVDEAVRDPIVGRGQAFDIGLDDRGVATVVFGRPEVAHPGNAAGVLVRVLAASGT